MLNSNSRESHAVRAFAIQRKQKEVREIKQSFQAISSGDSRILHSTENRMLSLSVKPVKQVFARISRTTSAGDTETLSFTNLKKTVPGDVIQSRRLKHLPVSECRLRTLPRKKDITVDFNMEPVTRMASAGDSKIIRNEKLLPGNRGTNSHFQDIVEFFTRCSEKNKCKIPYERPGIK